MRARAWSSRSRRTVAPIETVEGLSGGETLSELQEAFRRHHALQCGYCTPGILISLNDLLEREPAPDEARIREVLGGHLCRCTGYATIVDAALDAARKPTARRGGRGDDCADDGD